MRTKLRIFILRAFFPEYRRMSALLWERDREIKKLNSDALDRMLLIGAQSAKIKEQGSELEKFSCLSHREKKQARGALRK